MKRNLRKGRSRQSEGYGDGRRRGKDDLDEEDEGAARLFRSPTVVTFFSNEAQEAKTRCLSSSRSGGFNFAKSCTGELNHC